MRGFPGRTQTGELSLFATHVQLLSPCLHILPPETSGLKDVETRYRQRCEYTTQHNTALYFTTISLFCLGTVC